jgi:hypothetical protein
MPSYLERDTTHLALGIDAEKIPLVNVLVLMQVDHPILDHKSLGGWACRCAQGSCEPGHDRIQREGPDVVRTLQGQSGIFFHCGRLLGNMSRCKYTVKLLRIELLRRMPRELADY